MREVSCYWSTCPRLFAGKQEEVRGTTGKVVVEAKKQLRAGPPGCAHALTHGSTSPNHKRSATTLCTPARITSCILTTTCSVPPIHRAARCPALLLTTPRCYPTSLYWRYSLSCNPSILSYLPSFRKAPHRAVYLMKSPFVASMPLSAGSGSPLYVDDGGALR